MGPPSSTSTYRGSSARGGQSDPVIDALWGMGDYFMTSLWPFALGAAVFVWLFYKGYYKPMMIIVGLMWFSIIWARVSAGH